MIPTISIALCTYNGEAYLARQLESLFGQTFTDFELVAVDDGSSDNTVAILNDYASHDARLRVFANASNVGFRRNFEIAMRRCRGAFIAPCDQDDIWLPTKLAVLLDCISDHALAYCDSELVDDKGASLGVRISSKANMLSGDDPVPFIFANCVSGHALLVRRSVVERALPIPPEFFHDQWLAAVAATNGGIVFCNRVLVHYRQHGANVTDIMGGRGRKQVNDKKSTPTQSFMKIGQRIAALAALTGEHQAFVRRFQELWQARGTQWVSPAVMCFVLRHGNRLYAVSRHSCWKRWRKAGRFVIGMHMKRIVMRRSRSA